MKDFMYHGQPLSGVGLMIHSYSNGVTYDGNPSGGVGGEDDDENN